MANSNDVLDEQLLAMLEAESELLAFAGQKASDPERTAVESIVAKASKEFADDTPVEDLLLNGRISEDVANMANNWMQKQVNRVLKSVSASESVDQQGRHFLTFEQLNRQLSANMPNLVGVLETALDTGCVDIQPRDLSSISNTSIITLINQKPKSSKPFTAKHLRMSIKSMKIPSSQNEKHYRQRTAVSASSTNRQSYLQAVMEDAGMEMDSTMVFGSVKRKNRSGTLNRKSQLQLLQEEDSHAESSTDTTQNHSSDDDDDDDYDELFVDDANFSTFNPWNTQYQQATMSQIYKTLGWDQVDVNSPVFNQTMRTYRTFVWGTQEVDVDQTMVAQNSKESVQRPELNINWDMFSVPELENFLKILDAEEALRRQHITKRCRAKRLRWQQQIQQLEEQQLEEQKAKTKTKDSNTTIRKRSSAISLKKKIPSSGQLRDQESHKRIIDRRAVDKVLSQVFEIDLDTLMEMHRPDDDGSGTMKRLNLGFVEESSSDDRSESPTSKMYLGQVSSPNDDDEEDQTPALQAAAWLDSQIRVLLSCIRQNGFRDHNGKLVLSRRTADRLLKSKLESVSGTLEAAQARGAVSVAVMKDQSEGIVMEQEYIEDADVSTYTIRQLQLAANMSFLDQHGIRKSVELDMKDHEISFV